MRSSIILFILAFVLATINADIKRLPMYVGSGYNIISGSPLVNGVDPGFAQSIFQFKFTGNTTTDDGLYLVPDEVSHRRSSSCTLAS